MVLVQKLAAIVICISISMTEENAYTHVVVNTCHLLFNMNLIVHNARQAFLCELLMILIWGKTALLCTKYSESVLRFMRGQSGYISLSLQMFIMIQCLLPNAGFQGGRSVKTSYRKHHNGVCTICRNSLSCSFDGQSRTPTFNFVEPCWHGKLFLSHCHCFLYSR